MATAIATILVLTGEVAERFEREAQSTYERSLNRTEAEKKNQQNATDDAWKWFVRCWLNQN